MFRVRLERAASEGGTRERIPFSLGYAVVECIRCLPSFWVGTGRAPPSLPSSGGLVAYRMSLAIYVNVFLGPNPIKLYSIVLVRVRANKCYSVRRSGRSARSIVGPNRVLR